MGAEWFTHVEKAKSAKKAFSKAVSEAQYDFGHSGGSGTIAEKASFVMVHETPLSLEEAESLAETLLDKDDPRISDKWGPAGCIPLNDGSFFFLGWAPS